MTQTCTCCAVHGYGVHRGSAWTSPPQVETPEVAKANAARDKASAATRAAHEAADEAALAAHRFRSQLSDAYRSHPSGVYAATRRERKELERLDQVAAEKLAAYQAAGQAELEARQAAAVAQHHATLATLASWNPEESE